MSTCSCCHWWSQSPVISRGTSNNSTYTRKCIASGKEVTSSSERCKYFNPDYFYCDRFDQRLKYIQCLARRRNEKNLGNWEICKKCRQFDKEILPVIKDYFFDLVPIVTPRKLRTAKKSGERKIKRRKKEEQKPKKIKRRKKEEQKPKKIKRRKKEDDQPRKIKRRNK